jgi:hypothetical protein
VERGEEQLNEQDAMREEKQEARGEATGKLQRWKRETAAHASTQGKEPL